MMMPAIPVESAEDLYEHAPCGYVSTLADGTIARVNQTFVTLAGYSREELLSGQRLQNLMTVPGRAFYETHFKPLLRLQGWVKEIACDFARPGREPLPVLLNCTEVRGADGVPTHLRFTLFDATDRRRFENELMRARLHAERFKAIVDASAEAILSVDATGKVQSWNAAAERLFGYRASQAIGQPVASLLVPDGATLDFPALLARLRAGRSIQRDTTCRRSDGVPIDVSITLSPHVEPPDELVGASVIVHDNTERARVQARLRESEEQFRTIFELTPAGVVLIDPETNTIIACNEEAARANGYSREEFVGRRVLDIVAPELHEKSLQRRERILTSGGATYESRHVTKSGVERDVLVTVRMITILGARRMISVWEDITQRRKAEAALRGSQARLAMGVRVAGLALADVDYERGQVQLSTEAARMFGLGEEAMSVPRAMLHDTFHPDDRAQVLHEIEATLDPASNGWFAMELRVVWPDGRVRWVRVRKQAFFSEDEGGARRAVGALIAALDITAEKAADEAVRDSEQRFRGIFDNAAIGIAHLGLDGRFMRVNPRMCQISGYAAAEMTTMSVERITHPQDLATDMEQLSRMRAGEIDTYAREKRYVRKDGSIVWASLTVALLRDADGQPLHFIASVEDISARKAALEALEQQRRFVERLTDVVPSILYVFDLAQERYVWVNRQAGAALGFATSQADPSDPDHVLRSIHPDDFDRVAAERPLRAALSDGQTHESEFRLRHSDGSWRWFRSRETVFQRDADQRVLQVIGVASDIDDSKRAEQALREADRKKDAFIATLGHELRNPLVPIRNAVRLLRMKGRQDPDLERYRDIIDRQVGQMMHLVDDLLDVSRVTQGRLTLRRAPLDMASIVALALEIAHPIVESRRHALSVSLPDRPLMVDGDLTRLAQVFSNLLINAAKYTPKGGRIALQATREADQVVVRVSDSGTGIAAEHLPHIFEMFSRGKTAEVNAQDGLGIGLSLVKGMVTLHGGSVAASSSGPGQGSEFTVSLPLIATPALAVAVAPAPVTAAVPRERGPLRVLVADDSADITDTQQTLLEIEGFEVAVAYDGEQALALAEAFRPDVALCDLGMPRLNGYELARRLRSQPWGGGITLIAQTGWGQESDRQKTREAGFDHHMVKPVDPHELTKLLRNLPPRPAVEEAISGAEHAPGEITSHRPLYG